jgi:cytochrome c553
MRQERSIALATANNGRRALASTGPLRAWARDVEKLVSKRVVLVAAATLLAESSTLALDADKVASCRACHGERGVSQNTGVPSLAAQPDQYIQWQLVFFRLDSRKSEIMGPLVKDISNDDIKAFGAYFAALPPPPADSLPDQEPGLSAAGKLLAEEHHCNSCHTGNFAGQQATARLAGQREEVLRKALEDYRSGARRGTGIAAMPEAVYGLTDDDFAKLSHYLSRLP